MGCYHQMHAVEIGTTFTGKPKYYFIAGYNENTNLISVNGKNYFKTKDDYIPQLGKKIVKMPCGQCIGCRLQDSKEKAIRAMHELETSKNAIGISLTYNDEHLPIKNWFDENGELIRSVPTLSEEDSCNFNKRLRIAFDRGYHIMKSGPNKGKKYKLEKFKDYDINMFYAGEYGETNERPHYHQIWYNLNIPDIKILGYSKLGNPLYYSDIINEIWGKGFATLNDIEFDYVAYVARYILKKQTGLGKDEYYLVKGYEPEFARYPKKNALGKKWYEINKDKIYKNDELFIKKGEKVLKVKPPKYYDTKYDIENHEAMEMLKERRKEAAEEANRIVMMNTSKTNEEYLLTKEEIIKMKIKSLKRKGTE